MNNWTDPRVKQFLNIYMDVLKRVETYFAIS